LPPRLSPVAYALFINISAFKRDIWQKSFSFAAATNQTKQLLKQQIPVGCCLFGGIS